MKMPKAAAKGGKPTKKKGMVPMKKESIPQVVAKAKFGEPSQKQKM